MSEEKKVDEKKVEKKSAAVAEAPVKVEEQKKNSNLLPLIAIILACLMAVAVVFMFLNSQKLNKNVVDLSRQLTTLQNEEKEVGQRVLALEDELVVMGLKHRLNKIKKSRKNLVSLKAVLSDNPEMVKKVQALVDDLRAEQQRLKGEISGSAHKKFRSSRPLHGAAVLSRQPAAYQCCPKSGKCVLLPNNENVKLPVHAAPVPVQHGSVHAAAKTLPAEVKPQTGWSKFINTRLFGN